MNVQELEAHIERGLDALRQEFAGKVTADHVTRIGEHRFHVLRANATINDFIPLLVYRQTREALIDCKADELHESA